MRCTNKFGRGNVGSGNSLLFKVDNIVRTARDAAPSIAEGFNDGVTLLPQLSPEWLGGNPSGRQLFAPQNFFDAVTLTQNLFQTIQEERAFGFVNVQQADRLPTERIQPWGERFLLSL
jgi:hypothetical protein